MKQQGREESPEMDDQILPDGGALKLERLTETAGMQVESEHE